MIVHTIMRIRTWWAGRREIRVGVYRVRRPR